MLDVLGNVVDLIQNEALALERPRLQRCNHCLDLIHDLEHVDPFLGDHADRQRRTSGLDQKLCLIDEAALHSRDITQPHRIAVAPRQNHLVEVFDVVATRETNRVLPTTDVREPTGRIRIVPGEHGQRWNVDAQCGGLIGIEAHANFTGSLAKDDRARHTGNAFEARLHDLLDEILIAGDVVRIGFGRRQRKPCDGAIDVRSARRDPWLSGIDRVALYLIETVDDFDECAIDWDTGVEGQRDLSLTLRGPGLHLVDAWHATQDVLLRFNDFRFDFFRCGRTPCRLNRNPRDHD